MATSGPKHCPTHALHSCEHVYGNGTEVEIRLLKAADNRVFRDVLATGYLARGNEEQVPTTCTGPRQ